MSWFRETCSVIHYVVTLGGSEELADARQQYDASYQAYKADYDQFVAIKEKINHRLDELGSQLTALNKKLIITKLLLRKSQHIYHSDWHTSTVEKLTAFDASYHSVVNAGFGSLVGGASALGAWALVSVLGSASTGTAIVSLSGAAATNATLAWFGGGALAAGGAGMSGGMMVLGGIVALPAIYFATKGTYKKARQVREATESIQHEHHKIQALLSSAEQELEKILAMTKALQALIIQYIDTVDHTYQVIYPHGWLSRIGQWLKRGLGMARLNEEQQSALKNLEKKTAEFLDTFIGQQPASGSLFE